MASVIQTRQHLTCIVERVNTPAEAEAYIKRVVGNIPLARFSGLLPEEFTTDLVLKTSPLGYRLYEVRNDGALGRWVAWVIIGGQRRGND